MLAISTITDLQILRGEGNVRYVCKYNLLYSDNINNIILTFLT